ncbi:MAG: AraC family transcriptional regulator [Chitinophagaceae bacterium]|nr:MAG: AraC family transcriptional regulator [Chitinophagaceae bacterium]
MIRSPIFHSSLLLKTEIIHCTNEDGDNLLRIYADGQVGIVYYTSEQQVTFNGRVCAALFAYGQTLKPLEIKSPGNFSLLVAYLQPIALHAYFGMNAAELTDGCVDFKHIDKHISVQINRAGDWQQRTEILTNYLFNLQNAIRYKSDPRIFTAATEIISSAGGIRPRELHRRLRMTERTFERQFLKHVGITPSAYCRVCRFNAALQLLGNTYQNSLTDVAYHTGYADQSHFIRNFREFTSLTPSQYLSALKPGTR